MGTNYGIGNSLLTGHSHTYCTLDFTDGTDHAIAYSTNLM